MDNSNGPDDEITIDPLPAPDIPILRAARAVAGRVPALGVGVTVTGPGQTAPGHGSPGAVLVGFLAALSSQDPATACDYAYADAGSVARCKAQVSNVQRNQLPYGVSV